LMAEAIAEGVRAGRKSFLAGRVPRLAYASASSPLAGVVGAAQAHRRERSSRPLTATG